MGEEGELLSIMTRKSNKQERWMREEEEDGEEDEEEDDRERGGREGGARAGGV